MKVEVDGRCNRGLRLPLMDSRYGASLGRRQDYTKPPKGAKCNAQEVAMDASDPAYDTGGAYWGIGLPLYQISHKTGGVFYIRAYDNYDAMKKARTTWPGAVFSSEKRMRKDRYRKIREFKDDIRDFDIKTDPYGTAYEWLFDICEMLYRRGVRIPGYSPGAGGGDLGQYEDYIREATTGTLYYMSRLLNRYINMLKKNGKGY